MRELVEILNLDLSNLSEKGWENYYIDADFDYDLVLKYDALVKDLCNKIAKENFQQYKTDLTHAFINADDELVKSFGFDKIMVCPYKGFEMPWLNSNYIYMPYETKTLTIDIYDCQHLTYDEIYDFILQELFNFRRDATWVKEGIYEQKMEKMKGND